MSSIIQISQVIVALFILIGVLLQQRAAGFTSGVVGGTNIVQRRGAEKLLYQGTIIFALAFVALSVLEWFV